MISSHNIKIGLAFLLIVYISIQITIFQVKRSKLTPLSNHSYYFQEGSPSGTYETWSFNESFSEDSYLKLSRTSGEENYNDTQSACSSHVRLLRGFRRKKKGYITFGLSTVPRDSVYYLPKMLASLISKITEQDKNDAVVVVYLGSHNKQWVNMTLNMIDDQFGESVRAGLIQVIQPNQSIYPVFETITKRNYNDSLERVYWRTKQNIDYAFLFGYCDQLSKYYMHLEDDVITANDFMIEIKKLVSKMEKSKDIWFFLEFSSLGFIGKLFRSSDLCSMKVYFLLFKVEKPCDVLIYNLRDIKTQVKTFKSPKSLFQHFGLSSSLKGKVQKLIDRNFKDGKLKTKEIGEKPVRKASKELTTNFKSNKFPNPVAKIHTSMEIYESFGAERPYSVNMDGFFWAKSPKAGDFYRIEFVNSVNITEIQIKTGHPTDKKDQLDKAEVKVGNFNEEKCVTKMTLGSFKEGQFILVHPKPLLLITCLEIYVLKQQENWVIIYEIVIRTTDTRQV